MKLFIIVMSLYTIGTHAGIVDTIKHATESLVGTPDIAIGFEAEKQNQKEKLSKDLAHVQKELELFAKEGTIILEEIKGRIDAFEQELKQDPKNEIIQKKLSLCTDTYQAIKDNKRARERITAELEEFILFMNEFLKDPYFHEYQKKHHLSDQLYHTFEDVLRLHDMIADQKKQIEILTDQEKSARTELESRRHSVQGAIDLYKKEKGAFN